MHYVKLRNIVKRRASFNDGQSDNFFSRVCTHKPADHR